MSENTDNLETLETDFGAQMNEFVFHNNTEFENFQRMFTLDSNYEPIAQNSFAGFTFFPSNICDHVHMTFMYNDGERYKIINNRALYFSGFKEIKIQGSRSHYNMEHSDNEPLPILEIYNECADNAPQHYDIYLTDGDKLEDHTCHSFNCDDAIFNIQNEHESQVNVEISDIEIRVEFPLSDIEAANLYNTWYNDPDIKPVMFKVYEASSFKMFNVKLYSQFLNLTHVFLHWCENVEIVNCVFENYNARRVGGNLWLWDCAKNVLIENNDFRKYGNDENIGIWGSSCINRDENNCYENVGSISGVDDFAFANRQVDFENIHIHNNRFFYGKPNVLHLTETQLLGIEDGQSIENVDSSNEPNPDVATLPEYEEFPDSVDIRLFATNVSKKNKTNFSEPQWDGIIDIFNNLYFSQQTVRTVHGINNEEDENRTLPYVNYRVKDFVMDANEYYINSPIRTFMGITLDDFCVSNDISFTNSIVKYGPWRKDNVQLVDFRVTYDHQLDSNDITSDIAHRGKINLTPVRIANNTFDCRALGYMIFQKNNTSNYFEEEHYLLQVENSNIAFENNIVKCSTKESNRLENRELVISDQSKLGMMALWTERGGGKLVLKGNTFYGLQILAYVSLSDDDITSRLEMQAFNNLFYGGTTLRLSNINEAYFKFSHNRFLSKTNLMLLENMPLYTYMELEENVFKHYPTNESSDSSVNIVSGYCTDSPIDAVIVSHKNSYIGMNDFFATSYAYKNEVDIISYDDTIVPSESDDNAENGESEDSITDAEDAPD